MSALPLHSFHEWRNEAFGEVNGQEIVRATTSPEQEYIHLSRAAGWLDLSYRGRLCLLGTDREKFLHGQVTNDVAGLPADGGCYATIVDGKARLQADLFIYKLSQEILLDFEPGLTEKLIQRLEKYIIAEDVQVVDVSPHYGLLSLQGPESEPILRQSGWFAHLPARNLSWVRAETTDWGEIYLARNARLATVGFDLFVPMDHLEQAALALDNATQTAGGGFAGWDAFEIARIEAGIPRFGADMDETNLAPEAVQANAISYAKGCYIGQEIIARIRTYGSVAKSLRVLQLPADLNRLPARGEKLVTAEGKEVGYITSATLSPRSGTGIALGYVRREANAPATILHLGSSEGGTVTVLEKSPGQ